VGGRNVGGFVGRGYRDGTVGGGGLAIVLTGFSLKYVIYFFFL